MTRPNCDIGFSRPRGLPTQVPSVGLNHRRDNFVLEKGT